MSNPSGPPPADPPSAPGPPESMRQVPPPAPAEPAAVAASSPPPGAPRRPAIWRRNPRFSAAIAVVVIVAVAAGTVVIVRRGTGSASQPAAAGRSKSPTLPSSSRQSPATVAEQIMVHHANRDGQLDVAGALQLFSNAFTPLPGVTLPNGGRADAASYADLAIRSMLVHWPELTVDQRRALATVLNTSGARTVALHGDHAPAQLTAALVNAPSGLQVKVQQALLDEAKRLKHSLSDVGVKDINTQVTAVAANVELFQEGQRSGAWTWVTSGAGTIDPNSTTAPGTIANGTPTNCYIYFPPSFWQNLVWTPGSDQYDTLYHEVFHCYTGFVLGQTDLSAYDSAPGWLVEGSAEWAGDSMSGSNDFIWPNAGAPSGRRLEIAVHSTARAECFSQRHLKGRPTPRRHDERVDAYSEATTSRTSLWTSWTSGGVWTRSRAARAFASLSNSTIDSPSSPWGGASQ